MAGLPFPFSPSRPPTFWVGPPRAVLMPTGGLIYDLVPCTLNPSGTRPQSSHLRAPPTGLGALRAIYAWTITLIISEVQAGYFCPLSYAYMHRFILSSTSIEYRSSKQYIIYLPRMLFIFEMKSHIKVRALEVSKSHNLSQVYCFTSSLTLLV